MYGLQIASLARGAKLWSDVQNFAGMSGALEVTNGIFMGTISAAREAYPLGRQTSTLVITCRGEVSPCECEQVVIPERGELIWPIPQDIEQYSMCEYNGSERFISDHAKLFFWSMHGMPTCLDGILLVGEGMFLLPNKRV